MYQQYRLTILGGWLIAMLVLGGCGNKGPLYLPEPPAEPQSKEQAQDR